MVYVTGNIEVLMVITLDEVATYAIAERSGNWLKLKDYVKGVGDSMDVVVIGGRKRFTDRNGGFILACYNSDNEEFQSM